MILATKTYYEIAHEGTLNAFDTLEDAIEYAEENGITTIQEIGGCWSEFEKCWFCEEWFDVSELNTNNECSRCESAIRDHFDYKCYGTDGRRIS
jgi:hypothetical protein